MEQTRQVDLLWLESRLSGLVSSAGRSVPICGVTHDSRRCRPGYLFVAVPGMRTDGHLYIADARARGAVAAVVQHGSRVPPTDLPLTAVRDSRRALAELAAAFWGWPSRRLRVVGVTGTNGKTTTAMLVAEIARAAGLTAATLGTLGLWRGGRAIPTDRTTQEASDLQATLATLAADGVELVAMEVSSHGLALDRVWQTYFDAVVLTNITHDHLDFHRSFEDYAAAKARLLTDYPDLAADYKHTRAAVNFDDPTARGIAAGAHCPVIGFGLEAADAQVRAEQVAFGRRGTRLELVLPSGRRQVAMKLLGRFNVENALAAAAAAVALGLPEDAIVAGLETAAPAPGRMERVEAGQPFVVLVDYAHTPDALAKVLAEARRMTEGRVICVFGCGGDRDPAKRPRMGRIATQLADWTIITSDNPRSEDPLAIIEAIVAGAEGHNYEVVADRRRAIARAVAMAEPTDTVVIAGKGHETYQILADRTIHFDDREEARAAIEQLRAL